MSINIFTGDNNYLISRRIAALKKEILDPQWANFNFTTYPPVNEVRSQKSEVRSGFYNQAMAIQDLLTQPIGQGGRIVYLPNSSWLTALDKKSLSEVQKAVTNKPETTHLILSASKLDKRLKSVKFFLEIATLEEFNSIAPWDSKGLLNQVNEAVKELGLFVTPTAKQALIELIGNDTQRLYNELEKLAIYRKRGAIDHQNVKELVSSTTASSINLAKAILHRQPNTAITLLDELIIAGEPPLKIIATLTTLFRQWLWVKVMASEGQSNATIAKELNLNNPNRLFYLRQEVNEISLNQLKSTMIELLESEILLKSGCNDLKTLMLKIINQSCQFSTTLSDSLIYDSSSKLLTSIN